MDYTSRGRGGEERRPSTWTAFSGRGYVGDGGLVAVFLCLGEGWRLVGRWGRQ
jgi:hypothetical protein